MSADGNRRNPGTTADLIAATLFCRLICGLGDVRVNWVEVPECDLNVSPSKPSPKRRSKFARTLKNLTSPLSWGVFRLA